MFVVIILTHLQVLAGSSQSIDPIKFQLSTTATQVSLNEEFEIEISANYLNLPSSAVFLFEGSNSFRIRLITPTGFIQTGGSFSDNVMTELSPSKPSIKYTVKGKFTDASGDGTFQLLRNHKNSHDLNTYSQVAKLNFKMDLPVEAEKPVDNARIALAATPGYIPYLTIAELRAGAADTARVVYITDSNKSGLFRYNATSGAVDDNAMVLRHGNRRYERIYNGTVNVNWFDIIADGTTDHTAKLQSLLNDTRFPKLFFPASTSSYRIRNIKIMPNKNITFDDNVVVEGMGTLTTYEPMVYMIDVANITLIGKNVVFKDLRQNYTTGQQRHVFLMHGVTNVYIEGISANDGGGDGWYIGASSSRRFSENVKLVNVKANNNRRQGMSIVSGKNIEILNAELTNTNGEGPCAGLDIEPNASDEFLENIRIINPITRNNAGSGILIAPIELSGTNKMVNITIVNHYDEGSYYGLCVASVTSALSGSIHVQAPVWKDNKGCAFVSRNWSYMGPVVELQSPTAINANTLGSTSSNLGSAFLVYKATGDAGTDFIGNVQIINPKIRDTRTPQKIASAFCFRDLAYGNKVLNCSIIDPTTTPALTNNFIVPHNAEIAVSDQQYALVTDFGLYRRFLNQGYYTSLYHNQTSTNTRSLMLAKVNANYPEVVIEVRAPHSVELMPDATDNILPLSLVPGKYISSNKVGSRIKLKKTSDNSWFITEMIGTWTVQP